MMMCGTAWSSSSDLILTAGYGQGQKDIGIYRLGVRTPIHWDALEKISPALELQGALAFTHWRVSSNDNASGICLAPVFYYVFRDFHPDFQPYIEGGIGVAWIDDYTVGGRNLSSNFQFEDRLGLGIRYKSLDLNFRYLHYSNASIVEPNDGIDIWMSSLAWSF
ncbi:MAG: acyloxyacyl hydrolase [Desulfobacterales bacterium]|nr:acyloxyacyl hydrolase [Desulfobacterales bacterium]